jgi:tRNA nucleotidyltransferase/poly(A) polymerase
MNTKLDTLLQKLNEQFFIKELLKNGNVYLVGGVVRDSLLNRDCKDIDLLVSGIPMQKLTTLLLQFGKIASGDNEDSFLVGKSFGVLKFVPNGMKLDEPIDIAIPRVESCTGTGHKDFHVISSHTIPIELDLSRRDFTINAIAIHLDGTVIDPFNGLRDLKNGIIKMVDEVAFSDDPLRMLRAIQFASRLNFNIEANTFYAIKQAFHTIKFITPERILIELDKIFNKGNIETGFELLKRSGIYKQIFGFDPCFENIDFKRIKTRSDFYFSLLYYFSNKSEAFLKILKGDVQTAKCLDAMQFAFDNFHTKNGPNFAGLNRIVAFDMFKMSALSFESGILPTELLNAVTELSSGKFPKQLSELNIDGNDVMSLGFKNKEIGDALRYVLVNVLMENVENNKADLMQFIIK